MPDGGPRPEADAPPWPDDAAALTAIASSLRTDPAETEVFAHTLQRAADPARVLRELAEGRELRSRLRKSLLSAFAYATLVLTVAAAACGFVAEIGQARVAAAVESMTRPDGKPEVAAGLDDGWLRWAVYGPAAVAAAGLLVVAVTPRDRVPLTAFASFRRLDRDLAWHDVHVLLRGLVDGGVPFGEALRAAEEVAASNVRDELRLIRTEADAGADPATLLAESGRVPILLGSALRRTPGGGGAVRFSDRLGEAAALIRSIASARVGRLELRTLVLTSLLTAVGVAAYALLLYKPLFGGYVRIAEEIR